MSRSDWISLVGLLIGVPGFLLLVASDNFVIGLLIVGMIAVVGIAAAIIRRLMKSPPFIMKSVDVYLTIHDVQGTQATLKKEYLIVPMFHHLQELAHRNIQADGSITNLCWDGRPIPTEHVETVMGEKIVSIKFPGPLALRKEFSGCLSYDAANSFTKSRESLFYVVDFPAAKVNLTIQFPQNRVATAAHGFRIQGSGKVLLKDLPQIDNNTRTISLSLQKPRVGDEYEIAFDW